MTSHTPAPTDQIETVIVAFIRDQLLDGDAAGALTRDENLFTSGLVDSVGMVRLINHLREALGVSVPPTDLVPDNFRTVRVMAGYMQRLREAQLP